MVGSPLKVMLTFVATTLYARIPMSTILRKNYQSTFFVINVHEPYTTDAVYSDVPVDDNGFKYAQVIVGKS